MACGSELNQQASFVRLLSLALILFVYHSSSLFGVTDIIIKGGYALSGDVLKETQDVVYLDVGVDVIPVPKHSIQSIEKRNVDEVERGKSVDKEDPLPSSFNQLLNHLGESVVLIRTSSGLGSGFIIEETGKVITNDHVIAGEHQITITQYVRDHDNSLKKLQYENVEILAASAYYDLALLQIKVPESVSFRAVKIGNYDSVESGQPVFAIGSPLGLERSVSRGIVSLRNRLVSGRLYIQTTTQINPGNSGGPLFNLKGEVVGVNNMKVVAMGAEGLGFSIPSTFLKIFLKNRDAFAFDPLNPNSGFRYNSPPKSK